MRLGVYPGSFNPFHRGHYNILQKAEKIFDKVIIARGFNPEKNNALLPMPKLIMDNYIVRDYNCLLTEFIKESQIVYFPEKEEVFHYENVTVIRGLRNSVDLQYEMNQYRYLQDLMPDIQLISIFCDKEYEHISSSGIRTLLKYGSDKVKDYLLE
jgi:pantetheine-phosphate adenylyltransferase